MISRTYLKWDSNFFQRKVEKIVLDDAFSPSELLASLNDSPPDLCYIFTPPELSTVQRKALVDCGAIEYDRKIVYHKTGFLPSEQTEIIKVEKLIPGIRELSIVAGWRSRFNMDPDLHPFFHDLYYKWIEKGVSDPESVVFACMDNATPAGMILIKCNGNDGNIGLLAVNKDSRGKGIGTRLLKACDNFYFSRQVKTGTVATQEGNKQACHLYEKNGYEIISREGIWHWKRSNL
jgi:dTDP-4-amino-4,6-dideoxy-D-galactose acyltransferase